MIKAIAAANDQTPGSIQTEHLRRPGKPEAWLEAILLDGPAKACDGGGVTIPSQRLEEVVAPDFYVSRYIEDAVYANCAACGRELGATRAAEQDAFSRRFAMVVYELVYAPTGADDTPASSANTLRICIPVSRCRASIVEVAIVAIDHAHVVGLAEIDGSCG